DDVLSSARANSSTGELEAMPPGLRAWIARALQLDPRNSFASALEARNDLEKVLSGDEEEVAEIDTSEIQTTEDEPIASVQPHAAPPPMPAPFVAAPRLEPKPEPRLEFRFGAHEPPVIDELELEIEAPRRSLPMAAIAAAAIVVLALGGFAARKFLFAPATVSATGTFSVSTNPVGAQLFVDGQSRGVTPLTLALNPGPHSVELRTDSGEPRTMPITIAAGQQISQYVDLPRSVAAFGQLQIRTEPAGAQVTIDGAVKGKAPLLIDALTPGEHAIVLESDIATVKQTVTIEAGQTASLVVPIAPAEGAPISGWVSVQAPVELQLFENKK